MGEYSIAIKIAGQLENSFKNAIRGAQADLQSLGGAGKAGTMALKGIGVAAKATAAAMAAAGTGIMAVGTYAVSVGKEFEAQMSTVQAISGAAGEEFDALAAKAKEMGATTSFSATEAGQAMEYMAMAGWKTEDMLSGIDGIMNLAAASGEELAAVSDIVTDALTAFGKGAEYSSVFADQLAAASANANVNVEMLGESFKYAAPVAGALGFTTADTAEALALMGNAGIKASQAGTSMRATLTALTASELKFATSTGTIAVATQNADGTMRDLNAILDESRAAFANMTEAEQAQAAKTLVGKNAMSGFLALMNAAPADLEKVRSALEDSAGAAAEMAAIRLDNLEGDITLLKSAAEGFGISIYENMQGPLREMVQFGQEQIGILSKALESGGFEGLASSIGDVLANGISQIAANAPTFVDMAANIVESLVVGIENNAPEIGSSLARLATSLGTAFLRIGPRIASAGAALLVEFARGFVENLPAIKDAAFEAVGYLVGQIKEALKSYIGFLTDDSVGIFEKIIALLPAAAAGFMAFNGISGITKQIQGFMGALSGVGKVGQAAGGAMGEGFGGFALPSIGTMVTGLADLAILIGGVSAIIAAFGALSMIPGFDDFMTSGGESLANIFKQVGKIAGSVIGGIGEGIFASMPAIGDSLAQFGQNMQPFFDAISGAPMGEVGAFASGFGMLLLSLTANNITSFFTGGINLPAIGQQLSEFGNSARTFFETVAAYPDEGMRKAGEVFRSIAGIGSYDFKTGGLFQLFTGTTNIAEMGRQLSEFAPYGTTFFSAAAGYPEAGITKAAQVFEALSGIGNYDFKTGGLFQLFTGTTNIEEMGRQLSVFAPYGETFFNAAAGYSEAGLQKAPLVFEAISGIGNYDFKTGGLFQLFTGSTNIAEMGRQLAEFAPHGQAFFSTVEQFSTAGIQKSALVFNALSGIGNYDFKTGGLFQLFTGGTDMVEVGRQLSGFAPAVQPFFDAMAAISESAVQKGTSVLKSLSGLSEFKTGGMMSMFTGEIDVARIGSQLADFGVAVSGFYRSMESTSEGGIANGGKALEMLSSLGNMAFRSGGMLQAFAGELDLVGVANNLTAFAEPMAQFFEKVGGIGQDGFTRANQMFNTLSNSSGLFDVAQKSNGSLASFGQELVEFINSFKTFAAQAESLSGQSINLANMIDVSGLEGIPGKVDVVIASLNTFQTTNGTVISAISTQWTGFGATVETVLTAATTNAQNAATQIPTFFAAIDLTESGRNAIQGLIDGMESMRSSAMQKAESIANGIQKTVNDALEIHSPSQVMIESGQYVAEGLAVGMQNLTAAVQQASQALAQPVLNQGMQIQQMPMPQPQSAAFGETMGALTGAPVTNNTTNQTISPVFNFNPTYTFEAPVDQEAMLEAGKMAQDEFNRRADAWVRNNRRLGFA